MTPGACDCCGAPALLNNAFCWSCWRSWWAAVVQRGELARAARFRAQLAEEV